MKQTEVGLETRSTEEIDVVTLAKGGSDGQDTVSPKKGSNVSSPSGQHKLEHSESVKPDRDNPPDGRVGGVNGIVLINPVKWDNLLSTYMCKIL